MKIGVSNMSWSREQNADILPIVKACGYEYVESVYSKLDDSFPVNAIQSIFYGSGITDLENISNCLDHVEKIVEECIEKDISVITFGSPTMRVGDRSKMHMFLNGVNKLIKGAPVSFCVEPNAKFYGAEYYNTVSEIFNDLDKYENISTMIDVGNSILEDQDIFSEYDSYRDKVCHVHFASKGLKPIQDFNLYKNFIVHLKEDGYKGMVSYEFASSDDIAETIKTFSEKIIQNV